MIKNHTPQIHSQVNQLINSSRLNESFTLIKRSLKDFPDLANESREVSGLESTYRYLLNYMAEGREDPSRAGMLGEIRERLRRTNDILLKATFQADSPDSYSTAKRMEALKNATFESRLNDFTTDPSSENLISLFNYTWTIFGASQEDYETLSSFLTEEESSESVKQLLVSAIMLGNTHYFDSESFGVLLNAYEADQPESVRARIIVAICLISLIHSQRISENANLNSRLQLMKEDQEMNNLINYVLLSLLHTFDTKRVTNKMREEVIPGLMKINPEIIEKMRNMASDSEDFLSEENPEWEEIVENSGIQDKIQEINDMQMEGSDILMTTFSQLKTFPFFYQVANWFLPFNQQHPEFKEIIPADYPEDISKLTYAMCDSDIYSFMLSMKNFPESKRDLMLQNLGAQMKQAEEAMTGAVGDTSKNKTEREIRHSLQDLYRFFKLYRKNRDFKDPFETPFTGTDLKGVMTHLGITTETIRLMAEFYFKYGYYSEAAGMFELLDTIEPGNFGVWEKIGYCYDRLALFSKATEWYRKAEILNPGSTWLEKKLAVSLKNEGKYQDALEYYTRVLEKEPDNYHLLMSAGQCELEAGDYEAALQSFFHAQYLKPDKKAPARAIAWTRLLKKDFDKARADYEKITGESGADNADSLNAAFCSLAMKDMGGALKHLKKFLEGNNDFRALMTALRDDAATLKTLEIPSSDLRLVIDKLRYDAADL